MKIYPSGFRVRVKPGPRKYNAHVRGIVGSTGYVLESPSDWPGDDDDAVWVRIGFGIGEIDADFLEKIK